MKINGKEILKSIIRIGGTVFIVAFLAYTFLFFGVVEGASMESTLSEPHMLYGIKVKNLPVSVERGDIVGITKEIYGLDFDIVKRVIGIPGDEVRVSGTKVFLNGEELKEDYIKEEMKFEYEEALYKLGEFDYFVMGDNRNNSMDSRELGLIKKEEIFATILLYRENFKFKILF